MRSPNSTVCSTSTDSEVCTPSRLVEHGTQFNQQVQVHTVLLGLRMFGDLTYCIYCPRFWPNLGSNNMTPWLSDVCCLMLEVLYLLCHLHMLMLIQLMLSCELSSRMCLLWNEGIFNRNNNSRLCCASTLLIISVICSHFVKYAEQQSQSQFC